MIAKGVLGQTDINNAFKLSESPATIKATDFLLNCFVLGWVLGKKMLYLMHF